MSENLPSKHPQPWYARAARGLGLSAWVVAGLLGLSSLIILAMITSLPLDVAKYLTEQTIGLLILNASLYLIAVLVVIGIPYWFVRYVLRKPYEKGRLARVLGINKPFHWRRLGLFFLCIGGYLAGTILLAGLASLLPWFDANQEQEVGFKNLSGATDLILAFIALVILPPIAEELLFRGYLFGKLREQNGFWFSTILTSIIFGIVHMQWNVGIDVFVLSIFLCILREETGSIWMSILLHALKNGVAYFFLFIAPILGINLLQ